MFGPRDPSGPPGLDMPQAGAYFVRYTPDSNPGFQYFNFRCAPDNADGTSTPPTSGFGVDPSPGSTKMCWCRRAGACKHLGVCM